MNEQPTLTVAPEEWLALARRLRGEGYDQLVDLTCVDWFPQEPRFEVVTQLHNTKSLAWQRIKTRCGEANPPASLISIWPSANWFEREVFDLFGVRFVGHPNLTRMLLPDDWQGHPLRKDYPVEGYR